MELFYIVTLRQSEMIFNAKYYTIDRYIKFLLYLGVPTSDTAKTKPSDLLKVIAEFALEFRTTRERVLQQLEKRANHRERNKTRGKMIIDVSMLLMLFVDISVFGYGI